MHSRLRLPHLLLQGELRNDFRDKFLQALRYAAGLPNMPTRRSSVQLSGFTHNVSPVPQVLVITAKPLPAIVRSTPLVQIVISRQPIRH